MTTTDHAHTPCDWCRKPDATHTADQHPLPIDHPDYDAFYDATDDELAGMAAEALRNFGKPTPADRGPHNTADTPPTTATTGPADVLAQLRADRAEIEQVTVELAQARHRAAVHADTLQRIADCLDTLSTVPQLRGRVRNLIAAGKDAIDAGPSTAPSSVPHARAQEPAADVELIAYAPPGSKRPWLHQDVPPATVSADTTPAPCRHELYGADGGACPGCGHDAVPIPPIPAPPVDLGLPAMPLAEPAGEEQQP